MKDYFSTHSGQYKRFRPTYPAELYSFLISQVNERKHAWDCGTGNGQVAVELAKNFNRVDATDISSQQLNQAPKQKNIHYSVQPAEQTNFPDNRFDLITVAQAIHWFNIDEFYKEVIRTIKSGGCFAVIGYGLVETFPKADSILSHFYRDIVGPFWDYERRYLEEKYQTIPFPFREIKTPEFYSTFEWSFDQLIGYLGTWSSVQHYRNKKGDNPVDLIYEDLKTCWSGKIQTVKFPFFLRLGQKDK